MPVLIGQVVDWIKGKFVVATKSDLTVLHNRNKMVNAFSTTKWVSNSDRTIISRSVTSCAGITAYLVLAQTRVAFLSDGRGKSFQKLPTRTGSTKGRNLCTSYCCSYLDTTNLLYPGPAVHVEVGGAVTIIDCLKYDMFQ